MRTALLCLLAACSTADAQSGGPDAGPGCPPVTLTTGVGPRDVVIENGIARVTYPALISGIDQMGSHMLEVRVDGAWQRALEGWYADWTFFAAPFWGPAHTAHVLTDTSELVEVAFEFNHHLDYPGAYHTYGYTPRWWTADRGACTYEAGCRCYLAGCGVFARDWSGEAVYLHNLADVVKQIRHVRFWKVIGMSRCDSGFRVGYHSDPPLQWGGWAERHPLENSFQEREFGSTGHAVTFDVTGDVVRHPVVTDFLDHWFALLYQPTGPWWAAAIRGEGVPFVHVVSLEHPLKVAARQWSPAQNGTLTVHYVNPEIEDDGRVGRYQVALHAFHYVSPDLAAEPTPALRDLVEANLPTW